MIEFDTSKNGYSLNIDGKYYNTLDIYGFTKMMKNPSFCYKFYWLEAIVNLISANVTFKKEKEEFCCGSIDGDRLRAGSF